MPEKHIQEADTSTPSVVDVEVTCNKCGKIVKPRVNEIHPGSRGCTMLCPECRNFTTLKKEDAIKVEEYLKKIGKWDELLQRKAEKKAAEADDMTFVLNLIDSELADHKIKEDDRKSVRDFFEIQSVNILNWFDPYVIHWITANLDQMLRTLGHKASTVTIICGKVRTRLQLELMKRQREMQLTGMFQNYPVVQSQGPGVVPQAQPMPMFAPSVPSAPSAMPVPGMPGMPGMQQQLPFLTPGGVVMQPSGMVQVQPQPSRQPQQPAVQQPQQPAQQPAETIVEEVLDEKGGVKKRIIKKPGHESELERLISLGLLKPPAESTKETVKDVISETIRALKNEGLLGKENKSSLSSMIDTYGDRRTKELEEKIEEQRKEMEKLREELRKKELDELHYKMEQIEERHREELERVREEMKKKSSEGKPETVQTMEVRKDMLGKVSDDIKDVIKTSMEATVSPFVDVMRVQNLQTLLAWEEAGRIPKGTVNRMFSVRKATKEDVEDVKKKVARLREKRR